MRLVLKFINFFLW
ncbi:hypothetical protein B4U80_05176 [Leptotrombidium deliense]|uniref:Uncharacterized protein n=1 Tax=Leptotrombidium deliense TaxID=299467 RepID=A0A443Q8M1_9ACAR|nr:hypothetical protein B4U80_05176 [Leptotrombidium deliense]